MSRSSSPSLMRKLIAMAIVGAACLALALQYALLVQPAAAREVRAACNGLRPSPTNPNFGKIPSAEPVDFTARDHLGNPVKLSDFRGKVVFLNFWATWCNVCKSEKPSLASMTSQFKEEFGDDIVVITLASDPDWQLISELYPEGTPFKVLLDPPAGDETLGVIAKSFGLTAVPESFVVDRQGYVRHYFINKRDWDSDVAKTCIRAVVDEA